MQDTKPIDFFDQQIQGRIKITMLTLQGSVYLAPDSHCKEMDDRYLMDYLIPGSEIGPLKKTLGVEEIVTFNNEEHGFHDGESLPFAYEKGYMEGHEWGFRTIQFNHSDPYGFNHTEDRRIVNFTPHTAQLGMVNPEQTERFREFRGLGRVVIAGESYDGFRFCMTMRPSRISNMGYYSPHDEALWIETGTVDGEMTYEQVGIQKFPTIDISADPDMISFLYDGKLRREKRNVNTLLELVKLHHYRKGF